MIKAQIEIDHYRALAMRPDELQDYVEHTLSREIAEEVRKRMTVTKATNTLTNSVVYTGSVVTNGTVGITSGSVNAPTAGVQKNLRVIEYTKNGKVTRVELQQYDEQLDDWVKIPRIQKEE